MPEQVARSDEGEVSERTSAGNGDVETGRTLEEIIDTYARK
jgi:hypothetical protein